MLTLNWVKCNSNDWCAFSAVDLSTVRTIGVYLIWPLGQQPKWVRTGQGDIAARIQAHRGEPVITRYAGLDLRVSWATVSPLQLDGVERYLSDACKPLVGERFPEVPPIEVNLPM
jgi:hypothetical protein